LAEKYFGLPKSPRLHHHLEDGRRFLRRSKESYDLIFSDVYYSLYSVPAIFTTKEFFSLAKEKLADDGLFLGNFIGKLSRKRPSLLFSMMRTFREVFPHSYFIAVQSLGKAQGQNIIFVGSNMALDFSSKFLGENRGGIFEDLQTRLIDPQRFDLSSYRVLTDNYSPVEYLSSRFMEQVAEGFDGREALELIRQQLAIGARHPSAPEREKYLNFLKAELRAYVDGVAFQKWQHNGQGGSVYQLSNVIGRVSPQKQRRIILGTHYDSRKFADEDPRNPKLPVPGANDSASGVAVLLELARALKEKDLDFGIDYVFFDAEEGEEGLSIKEWKALGSEYFAANLREFYPEKKPFLGIVLDMVCEVNLRLQMDIHSLKYSKKALSDFWELGRSLYPEVFESRKAIPILDDHSALNKAGIPSFVVIDPSYPHWHTTRDTLDKCSAASLEAVGRNLELYLLNIGGRNS
jgi:hypothetical protein